MQTKHRQPEGLDGFFAPYGYNTNPKIEARTPSVAAPKEKQLSSAKKEKKEKKKDKKSKRASEVAQSQESVAA